METIRGIFLLLVVVVTGLGRGRLLTHVVLGCQVLRALGS